MRRSKCRVTLLGLCLSVAGAVGAEEPIIPPEAALPTVDWKDAHKYLGKEVVVQGKIVQTRDIGKISFLNFDAKHSFTAIVRDSNYKNFPMAPERLYDHKLVRIRGVITEYRGKPQIEVFGPEQVTVLERAEPIPPKVETKRPPFGGTVTVATFNALNLFDEYDDPYHSDEGTSAKPRGELEKLAATIRALDADVLALQEIENRGYLERFVAAMLGDMGYQHVVCYEGNDRRGIDCAVLSRFPVGPVTSYRHQRFPDGTGNEMSFRRDLLQVRIEPPGCPSLDVFVVHLKSKRGGADETTKYRVGEARQARRILDNLLQRDPKALFLICGDFNDTPESKPLTILRGDGATALHCFLSDVPKGMVTLNRGFDVMFDFILVSPALAERYVAKSYRIIPGSVASTGSDHNPVLARFKLKPKE